MKKAIIFDLDGTLWDATGCSWNIWNDVLEKHEEVQICMSQEKTAALMGKTLDEIGEMLFPEMSERKRKAILNNFSREEVKYLYENGAVLYEGVNETLDLLSKEYDLYIVSNCQDGYVQAFLNAHKLEGYFKDIEMFGRTGFDKGRNIRILMERNDIKSAVYVGDTEGDEKASRYAGIPFIYAAYGFGKAVSPDAVIKSIEELLYAVRL